MSGTIVLSDLQGLKTDSIFDQLKFFQFSLEVAADIVICLRADGKALYFNQTSCDRLGYSVEEAQELYVWDWDPNLSPEAWQQFWQTFKKRKKTVTETLHKTKHGEVFPVELRTYYFSHGNDDLVISFATDVTEKRKSEAQIKAYQSELELKIALRTQNLSVEKDRAKQKLKELEVAHKKLTEMGRLLMKTGAAANVGSWVLDFRTGDVQWDTQIRRIFGVSDEFVPKGKETIENFYSTSSMEIVNREIGKAIAGEGIWDFELPLKQFNGNEIWVREIGEVEFSDGRPTRLFGTVQDITHFYETRSELIEKNELLHITLESIGDGLITTDANAKVTWLNPMGERITGWSKEQAIGQPLSTVFNISPSKPLSLLEDGHNIFASTGDKVEFSKNTMLTTLENSQRFIEGSASNLTNAQGQQLGLVVIFNDVTEARKISSELEYRASHDSLTGLLNLSELEIQLSNALHRTRKHHEQYALLYLDLDNFKFINESIGHRAGNGVLIQMANILTSRVSNNDSVFRIRGDHFVILLKDRSDVESKALAESICADIAGNRFSHEQKELELSVNIGLVMIDDQWENAEILLSEAANACFTAKSKGQNSLYEWVASDDKLQARRDDMEWVRRIEDAFQKKQFVLFAQQIFLIGQENKKLHLEVLVRLIDENGDVIPAGAFLPIIEKYNYATRLDRYVLKATLNELNDQSGLNYIELVAVNLSGKSISDRSFCEYVFQELEATPIDTRKRLCLEVTETEAIKNMSDARDFISRVRAYGVKVALDDFGAGASSFSYIKHLPVDILKIDGQFVVDLVNDELDEVAVRSFVEVARVRGVKTVAEFVDNPDVLKRLAELKVDYSQGFLLHKPERLRDVIENFISY